MPVGDRQREPQILFHEQHGEAAFADRVDRLADPAHHDRGQAFGRLVQQQQPCAGTQDAGDRQHLLLAAGQLRALAARPLPQCGEEYV